LGNGAAELSFDIVYRKGETNIFADALSRAPDQSDDEFDNEHTDYRDIESKIRPQLAMHQPKPLLSNLVFVGLTSAERCPSDAPRAKDSGRVLSTHQS